VLVVQEDQRCGGDRADPPRAEGDPTQPLKVVLSSEFPRSASARVAECRALIVRGSTVNVTPRVFLIGQLSLVFSPS
jgi:hypothetical protein